MTAGRLWFGMALLMLTSAQGARGEDARVVSPGFSDHTAWNISADSPWWALVDLRAMLNLFHPYAVSKAGTAAGATREITLPSDWKPPFALRFFCADDYFADAGKHRPGQVGVESFFDHRFKQVLIDERVVWERDVADENTHGAQTTFQADVTPYITPGKPFRLTFRVRDKVSTEVRDPRDVWFIKGTWYAPGDGKTEQLPRFHTAVWFADPIIGEKQAVDAAPPGARPHEAVVRKRHQARWPLLPRGERPGHLPDLRVVAPATTVSAGFPLTCGIPLPPGALKGAKEVSLGYGKDDTLPAQSRPIGFWPDGSVRWLLLDTILPAGTKPGDRLRLRFDKAPPPKSAGSLKIQQGGGRTFLDTGALHIQLGSRPDTLLDAVQIPDKRKPILTNLSARMTVRLDGKPVPVQARWDKTQIMERGPVKARIELSGTLDAAHKRIGRFLFRLYAYAGLPSLHMQLRIFNDLKPEPFQGTIDDPPLDVADLALVAMLPDRAGEKVVVRAEGPEVGAHPAPGWIAADGPNGSVQASLRWFQQQFPKALAVNENRLEIGLFAPTRDIPLYQPRFGEAKRHDIWLTFSKKPSDSAGRQAFAQLAEEPPRLFDGDWFCTSGAISVLDPQWLPHQPPLAEWIKKSYGDVSSERITRHFGIRDFGDFPYREKQWRNGYWAMVQGALNWGLASGDQRWIHRSFEIARHIADVDTVHLPPDHPDWDTWNGLTCALGTDHSVHDSLAKWPAFQIGESLLLHYWMTGDPDSLADGLANADYLMRQKAGLGSSEARSQARPMLTLLRAWQVTRKPAYREAAARYLDLRYQKEHVIDWRRGAYIQPTYENWRCISAGLDAMYAHNIYEYYRLTGDLDAAQMVVAIADSVYAESMLPQEEGIGSFLFYVRYSRTSWYYTQMAMLFFMAYDLTEDLRFLRAGRAAFARYLLCADASGNHYYQPYDNFGWLDPEAGGWLREFARVPTAPSTITGQTPVPDPAQYEIP